MHQTVHLGNIAHPHHARAVGCLYAQELKFVVATFWGHGDSKSHNRRLRSVMGPHGDDRMAQTRTGVRVKDSYISIAKFRRQKVALYSHGVGIRATFWACYSVDSHCSLLS